MITMSIKGMVSAARAGNPVEFEKNFVAETQSRLATALAAAKTQVVANVFGINEEVEEESEDNE